MTAAVKSNFLKLLALFAVVRGYNVAMLVLAMYLTAYFIFSKDTTLSVFFSEWKLHLIVLSSALTISAGYIINNFYDLDKDRIARPISSYISKYINQNFKLSVYLILNLIALTVALSASWRVALFFFVYQFLVWFYSHRLNKVVFINNLFYVVLSMMPFLALLLYYNNFAIIIFFHGLFLGFLLWMQVVSKNMLSYKADLIYDYKTLPVVLGQKQTKMIFSIFILLACAWSLTMSTFPKVGHMKLYFWIVSFILFLMLIFIWKLKKNWQYMIFNLIFKLLLGIGVISIAWIKINPLDLQKFFP